MEKKWRPVKLALLFVLITILPVAPVFGQEGSQDSFARQQAARLLETLSPEEKIGQLFLITFDGNTIDLDSEIYRLITEYHVGGVVLDQSKGNVGETDPDESLRQLISDIQSAAYAGISPEGESTTQAAQGPYIPLFIGVSQPGGGYPYDGIFSGFDPLPSPMAVGATWDTTIAEDNGELLGNTLESLGFNLLLGPSLDVLDVTYTKENSSLGVRTFGGDPYWVGEMGAAFISGVHIGSAGRLAVIARNFPGRGSTDRLPTEEVSTVRKSLEQLKLIELAPFFRITDTLNTDSQSISDGLLASHIRYQGFQGNIRATTKPISFDQNAMDLLMALDPLFTWRLDGGLLVSDDLGSQAVNKFFNPNVQFIDARQIAKNAVLAGNDVLYMDEMLSTGDANRFETYRKSIDLLVQKYREDSAFAERVDGSVLRILTLKYTLYDDFSLDTVLPGENIFSIPLEISDLSSKTAQKAATLINPSQSQLDDFIASPPRLGERMIIFTNDQTIVPCEDCQAVEVFPVNGLQKSILKLYGPEGSGQISPNHITSYSFRDLDDYLASPINRPEIEQNLSEAKWVIFALREIDPDEPTSYALHNLVSENEIMLREKNVLVFSFDAPYYFDATEISAFSAYYALYSKLPAFIDVAARIIFQEINPTGSSPVSIPGIGYDLIMRMTPDSSQIIRLSVDEEAAALLISELLEGENPLPETLVFKLGDTLPVITGVILDQNGKQVPDGTPVIFTMSEQGNTISMQQVEAQTKGGIAKASFILQNPGIHEIKVSSDPARNSEILVIDISQEEAIVSAITPTLEPEIEETAGPQPAAQEPVEVEAPQENNKSMEWLFATALSWIFSAGIFYILHDYFILDENLKISSIGLIGGLSIVTWMLYDLPGVSPRYGLNGFVRLGLVVFFGVLMGAIIGWLFLRIRAGALKE